MRDVVAPANLVDYRARSTAFAGLAGYAFQSSNLTGAGRPDRLLGESVTANYFRLLGVSPALGRDLVAEDDRPDADGVVILSHDCWERRFGGDPALLGRTILLDDRPTAVIGILPAGFASPSQLAMPDRVEFYVPAAYPAELLANHGDHEIRVLGRLKPGATIVAAQAELDVISAALAKQYPHSNRGVRAVVAPLRDDMVRNVRTSLLILLGAVGLIVLITCVNVANLMLVRAASREHETAVRFALGASRGRVVRQFLVESLVLSAAGCAAGVLLGSVMMRVLSLAAPREIPRIDGITMDWRVLAVSAAVAVLSGIVFGVLPAWQASRARPAQSLRGLARVAGARSHARWRAALTVAELAISLVLLVAAGLLLKSFVTVVGMDVGFRTENVLVANITLPEPRYATQLQRLQFFEELERRVAHLPGVESVAFANRMPLRGGWGSVVQIDGAGEAVHDASPSAPGARDIRLSASDFQAVSPGYSRTMGIALVRGRTLAANDRDGADVVAVVNQAFVRRFLGGTDPIGRRLRRYAAPWLTIVGVVGDIRRDGKTGEINPQVYLAAAQTRLYPVRLSDFAVRASGDPRSLLPAIQSAVWSVDKDQPVTNVRTLDEIIELSVRQRRFQVLLLLIFAGVALALSLVGIFGVLAYIVSQRTSEFGIRLALGAPSRTILSLVMRRAAGLIASGVLIGTAGAWSLTRYLESLLFEVRAHDAGTYVATALLLVVVSVLASVVPARRAARVDPIIALRYE
jgi:putative ABC transport system permease protein